MIVGGVWFGLTLAGKTLAGTTGHFGARVAQIISFVAMALVIFPYLVPSVFGQ